ncbi:unnamed protein product [Ascophyllum nodosum]
MASMYHEKQYLMHCAVHTLNNLFQEQWATASLLEDIAKELFDRDVSMRKEAGMGGMWINPYKCVVPRVGYYDITVLLEALKLKDCHVSVHAVFNPKDPAAVARSTKDLDPRSGVRGVVVNRVTLSVLGGLVTGSHYYAIVPWVRGTRPAIHHSAESEPLLSTPVVNDTKPSATPEAGSSEHAVRFTDGDDIVWYVVDSKAPEPELIGGVAELALHLGMEAREHQAHVFVISDGKCPEEGGDAGASSGECEKNASG